MKLSIVIPVYNEAKTIKEVIRQVRSTPFDTEILVVDDGSTDETWEILQSYRDDGLKAIRHERNRGKGAALRTAFQQVSGDVVIVQDADLEYDPREYPTLLQPIVEERSQVVLARASVAGRLKRCSSGIWSATAFSRW